MATQGERLQVIYLDNSYSMSASKGVRSMLDIARDAAIKQVRNAKPDTRFVLLTNDKPVNYHSDQADKILSDIQRVEVTAAKGGANKALATTQGILKNEGADGADIYYYSDFQENGFPKPPHKELMDRIRFFGVPVQPEGVQNVYIDTSFLTTPVLQADKSNYVVVRTRSSGATPKENPVLSLSVNGQVKSAASLDFSDKQESVDTLSFQVNDAGWQEVKLTVNDASMRYDDTFRIAARCAPNLSVLVLNEGQLNPYIQAAFRAYNGFRLHQEDIRNIPTERKQYNLLILNGVTAIDEQMGKMLNEALVQGQSVCIFPGKTANIQLLNEGLKQIGDIQIERLDTTLQSASLLQQGSALVRDLFDKIPDNVQLPAANWHYIIRAGLSANQQTVLGFRNGDPLLARYTPSGGQLYLCASSADLQAGNFPGSYFFTPFLYMMAMQSGGGSVFAVTSGNEAPVYLALNDAVERNTIHAYGAGVDVIPPQRSSGAGLNVYVGQALQQPGFYTLAAPGTDTTEVALNQDNGESLLSFRDIPALRSEWKGDNIKWMDISESGGITGRSSYGDFPLWKVCVILALVMLAAETFLLSRKKVKAA